MQLYGFSQRFLGSSDIGDQFNPLVNVAVIPSSSDSRTGEKGEVTYPQIPIHKLDERNTRQVPSNPPCVRAKKAEKSSVPRRGR